MEKKYAETADLRVVHCDMHGDWRPAAILEAMQETAGAHCARLGIGRDVTDALGVAWVLSRARVELARTPRLNEEVTVETWPLPTKHLFYPRANRFLDGEGREIGGATSLWVLMDVKTRRMVASDAVAARLPDNGDMPFGPGMPATVRPQPGLRRALTPAYTDFDVNGHVNNARYMDWCCAALGFDAFEGARLARFDVNYEGEILPGAQVETELALGEGSFTFCGSGGGRRLFAVSGVLAAR